MQKEGVNRVVHPCDGEGGEICAVLNFCPVVVGYDAMPFKFSAEAKSFELRIKFGEVDREQVVRHAVNRIHEGGVLCSAPEKLRFVIASHDSCVLYERSIFIRDEDFPGGEIGEEKALRPDGISGKRSAADVFPDRIIFHYFAGALKGVESRFPGFVLNLWQTVERILLKGYFRVRVRSGLGR